ncbi:NADPH-dependent FMN reductase [Ottowia sp. VDI28]|uniref:NADPH-dependent FMN reductase n=1 Tax=Ottowia sp. VDI28 TaxID=3133968 RepID=UPI003C2BCBC3
MEPLHILIIPGSVRRGSLNLTLATAASHAATRMGARVSVFDLRELELPVYDGDLEAAQGVPPGALKLQDAIAGSDGILIVTPEYNGFPTPLVINSFDWLSRIQGNGARPAGLATTANKPAALLSASPGAGGAMRSMNFLRQYLQMAFQMIVVPQQFALGRAHEAFNPAGELADPRAAQSVEAALGALASLATALRSK